MTPRFGSLLVAALLLFGSSGISAGSTIESLTFVPGIGTGWMFYAGTASWNGGAAGEWHALVDGAAATGYFCDPWAQTMSTGVVGDLDANPGGTRAAWLIDQFALGLGRDGIPPGWTGGPATDEEKRTALAFAVYEVGMSPLTDPLSLSDGYFWIWAGPELPRTLGQAYLDALAGAAPDPVALEATFDLVVGDQWTGNGYAQWVALVRAGESLFADGFEEGGLGAWSGAAMTVPLPGDVPLTLVLVPAGTFQMGSPESERGRGADETLHEVTLTEPYWLGTTEVTQAQWEAVTGTPMSAACGSYGVGPAFPVYCVSWEDIAGPGGFLDLLNTHLGTTLFRLPTEAEWERAARGGTQTRFSHGDVLACDDECGACAVHDLYMSWCGNLVSEARPVGSKGANPFGLHDMHGNLWEWVQDWYDAYPADPVADPTGPASGSHRVVRGGGWYYQAHFCRSAYRSYDAPTSRNNIFGFRLARSQ
ncbi:MAG TPA: formylglycine-generating enzyme family protein [Thermoanaerobaculia bacterium]|nr:formylglycine-generating enzyme family protein [Thermoanaerobaculia bacterium]